MASEALPVELAEVLPGCPAGVERLCALSMPGCEAWVMGWSIGAWRGRQLLRVWLVGPGEAGPLGMVDVPQNEQGLEALLREMRDGA